MLYLSGSGLDLKSSNQFYRVWLSGYDNKNICCHVFEQKVTEERLPCEIDAAEFSTMVYILTLQVSVHVCT